MGEMQRSCTMSDSAHPDVQKCWPEPSCMGDWPYRNEHSVRRRASVLNRGQGYGAGRNDTTGDLLQRRQAEGTIRRLSGGGPSWSVSRAAPHPTTTSGITACSKQLFENKQSICRSEACTSLLSVQPAGRDSARRGARSGARQRQHAERAGVAPRAGGRGGKPRCRGGRARGRQPWRLDGGAARRASDGALPQTKCLHSH